MPAKGKGVRVVGTCANGHVTQTTSEPGRVQAIVDCGTDGCDQTGIRCRRVPKDAGLPAPSGQPAEKPPAGTATGSSGSGSTSKVKEVRFREQGKRKQQPKQGDDSGDGRTGGGAAGVQQPGAASGAPGGGPDGSGPAGGGERPAEQPQQPEQRPVDVQRRDPVGRWSGSSRFRGAVARSRERGRRRREAEKEWIIPNVLQR